MSLLFKSKKTRNAFYLFSSFILTIMTIFFSVSSCNKSENEIGTELHHESFLQTLHVQDHFIQLYQKYLPATVTIALPEGGKNRYRPIGAGFFINSEGFIITCRHVVGGNRDLLAIQGSTGTIWPVKVFNTDNEYDLALLKIIDEKKTVNLPFIPIVPDIRPKPGSLFIAIGAPHGLKETMIAGFISQTLRLGADSSMPNRGFIQLSSSVLPGSSGGPVLDISGKLIGMMRFTLTPYGLGSAGPGFATPANSIYFFIQKHEDIRGIKERNQRGIVEIPITTPYLVKKLGLPHADGVLVSFVKKDSPAMTAGIKRYDFITHVQGKPVRNASEFQHSVQSFQNKNKLKITIFRHGEIKEYLITGFSENNNN